MISSRCLLSTPFLLFTVSLLACESHQEKLCDGPRQFQMTIEDTLQVRESHEDMLDYLVRARNMLLVGSTFYGHVLFLSNEWHDTPQKACLQCACPIGGFLGAACIHGIIRTVRLRYEQPVIDGMRQLDPADQEVLITSIAMARQNVAEITWLHACQNKANAQKLHQD